MAWFQILTVFKIKMGSNLRDAIYELALQQKVEQDITITFSGLQMLPGLDSPQSIHICQGLAPLRSI